MSKSIDIGPNITIMSGLQVVFEDKRSECNSLPDLLKTLKEFQDDSNAALTEIIAKMKVTNVDDSENDNLDEECLEQEQKKMKLVHTVN